MSKLKVGLVQQSKGESVEQNIMDSLEAIASCAKDGAELIVLQELHCSRYFCQVEETDQFDLAEKIPGPVSDRFAQAAKEYNVVLVTSLFEKRAPGIYHNTAVVFEKDGSVAGTFRKMHIPDDPAYYEKFYGFDDAVRREKQLKKWKRSWKIDLIESINPYWKDLSHDWYSFERSRGYIK